MDIKGELTGKINEVVNKIKSDKDLQAKFQKDPVKAVESIIGVDLPDDQVNKLIEAVKAKIAVDNVSEIAGKLGSILGKK